MKPLYPRLYHTQRDRDNQGLVCVYVCVSIHRYTCFTEVFFFSCLVAFRAQTHEELLSSVANFPANGEEITLLFLISCHGNRPVRIPAFCGSLTIADIQ